MTTRFPQSRGQRRLAGWLAAAAALALAGGLWWWLAEGDAETDGTGRAPLSGVAQSPRQGETIEGTPAAEGPREALLPAPGPGAAGAGDDPPRPVVDLTVRHADGALARGVRVAAARRSAGGWDAWELDQGVTQLPAEVAAGPLWVAGASADLERGHAAPSASGSGWDLRLPVGAVFAGTVRLDGGAPPSGLQLALRAHQPGAPDLNRHDAQLREALRPAASGLPGFVQPLTQTLGGDGRFHFSGLAAGLRGRLYFPDEYLAGRRWGSVVVSGPATSFVLELSRCPTLAGVVLDPDGAPSMGATIEATIESLPTARPGPRRIVAADGHFALPCGWDPGPRVTLRIVSADATAGLTLRDLDADRAAGRDLGTLRLRPLRTWTLEVTDPDGAPLAGALAYALGPAGEPAPRAACLPTDGSGRASLSLTEDTREVAVLTEQHSTTRVALSESATTDDGLLRVVLRPCATIELALADTEVEDVEGLRWLVELREPLFDDGADIAVPALRLRVGASVPAEVRSLVDSSVQPPRVSGALTFPAGEGVQLLSAVRPGVLFDVALRDALGQVLWSRIDQVLSPGAQVRYEATLADVPTQELRGEVVDGDGLPVARANVYVGPAGEIPLQGTLTDSAGRFEFSRVGTGLLRVDVQKVGFQDLVVDPAPSALRLVLRRTP